MPTGVTVSHQGRVFVNFPKWGDEVEFTLNHATEDLTLCQSKNNLRQFAFQNDVPISFALI
jgi:hypothetical protein